MFEAFKSAFAADWGLIATVLSFALIVGIANAVAEIVKTAKMQQKIKRRLAD